jgi:hypothetical protein
VLGTANWVFGRGLYTDIDVELHHHQDGWVVESCKITGES